MNNHLNNSLLNFKRCADEAPEGAYEDAKRLNEVIGDTCNHLMRDVRALGLKANNCDLIFSLEAAIYDYVKRSNPEYSLLPTAEGFGASLDGPACERAIAQAEGDRDFLRGVAA